MYPAIKKYFLTTTENAEERGLPKQEVFPKKGGLKLQKNLEKFALISLFLDSLI